MERGPAVLFTKEQMTIEPEPPLAAGFDRVEAPGLDGPEQSLSQVENDLTAAHEFLNGVANDFKVNIDGVQNTLDTELVAPEESVPQVILDEIATTQQAIDGAESSFLPDAYVDQPPWYQPVSDAIPDEPPPPSDQGGSLPP
jgi:hypothetical protein